MSKNPCPTCAKEAASKLVSIEVCIDCYRSMQRSGAIPVPRTDEFAAVMPGRTGEFLAQREPPPIEEGEMRVSCTWCGRGESEVKKMLSGPRAHICNECVALSATILDAELGDGWR